MLGDKAAIGECVTCHKLTLWLNDKLVYPMANMQTIKPNPDMPEHVKQTFTEAQACLGASPFASCILLRLCLEQLLTHLGFNDARLIDKIKRAAPNESPLRRAMDACRITGNAFVHADSISEMYGQKGSNPEDIAKALSDIINFITEEMISRELRIQKLLETYSKH